ncbi:MAG: hypothetical protein R3C19_15885 [Planctomycetaceae bacterium]
MKKVFSVVASALMLVASAQAADVKSGLQVGDSPAPFNVLDVTGPQAGEKLCYRCKYGSRPVVSIFTRKMDDKVAKLVKEIDGVVGKNEENKMAAFVVLLTDTPEGAEAGLKKTAESNKITHTPLTVFENSVGPADYKIDKNAEITVMMWVDSNVKVNKVLTEKELSEDAIKKVAAETKAILE